MKKSIFFFAALLWVSGVYAQITFWGTGNVSSYNAETQQVEESVKAFVADQYEYQEVDSVSLKPQASNSYYALQLWKNKKLVNNYTNQLVLRNAYTQAHPNSKRIEIDSIVWHPYTLQEVWTPLGDTLPVALPYGNPSRAYGIEFEPALTSASCEVSVADTTIVQASYISDIYGRGTTYFSKLSYLLIQPLAVGSTTVTLTFNNSIRKELKFVVIPKQPVPDETSISVDSLYNKIYSRLAHTGNMRPAGAGDLRNVDEGFSGFHRGLFMLQELGADQLFWIWNDAGIDQLRNNTVAANNAMVYTFFYRVYYNIWMCNSYLSRTEGQAELATQRAEIRFLRAYFYYCLLDLFGNVPVVTENAVFATTPQSKRAEVYAFVEAELLAAEQELPAEINKSAYYRLDKAAAWLLLSRLYLNAPVYAGTTAYDKAAEYAYKVIESVYYTLASQYSWLFMGDNDTNSASNDAWREMIFTIRQDGQETASYGGSIYLIATMSDQSTPSTGLAQNWKCIRSRGQLVDLFFADPANAARGTATELTQAAGDDRALFCNEYNGYSWRYKGTTASDFNSGWVIQKWSNLRVEEYPASSTQWPDTDIPILRKAEAYLNYAEAVFRGGKTVGGLPAVEAVNVLRRRAHASEVSSLSLDFLLDERGREFYAEGCRRSDLIRFGKFGGETGYQWEQKSGTYNGTNFPAYMNLYPIPTNFLPSIEQGYQNEGY
ncbi:MAG: RagB/SusD family nutrient uptake outer membrane protein [Paludibacteraceae bacterium]|nr:RagB/SusD family nutrient uptake outer membrane protein [Paludibacteraceae bacterium]